MGNGGRSTPITNMDSLKDKIKPLSVFHLDQLSREEVIHFLSHPNLLTKRYRELIRKHHPDRGGSALKCSIINYAFEQLKTAQENLLSHTYDASAPMKTGGQLRQEFQNQNSNSKPKRDEKEVAAAMKKLIESSNPDQFQKQFNEAFELSRMKDYTDDGYDIAEKTTSVKRTPIAVKRVQGVTQSNMNDMFEKNTKVNRALIIHENKQPEGISSLKHSVYEYGKKKETDFGRHTNGASDYGIAFAGERLVDFDAARPKDKELTGKVSVKKAQQMRSNQNLKPEMTDRERELWAEEQEQAELEEEERKAHMVEMDYQAGQRQNIFIERMLTFVPNQ